MPQQMTIFDWLSPDSASGKMSQAHCLRDPRKEQTSKPSSRSSSASQSRMLPMFLFLQSGGVQESSWEDLGPLLTRSMMPSSGGSLKDGNALLSFATMLDILPLGCYLDLNFGEKPKMENPTKRSDILEEQADSRYNLSSRACQGILNRAAKRGKVLPEILQQALENQIDDRSDRVS